MGAVVAAVTGVAVSDFIVRTAAAATTRTMVFVGFVTVYWATAGVVALPLAPGTATVLTVAAVAVAFWLAAVVTRRRRGVIHGLFCRADRAGSPIADLLCVDEFGLREVHAAEDLLDEERGKF